MRMVLTAPEKLARCKGVDLDTTNNEEEEAAAEEVATTPGTKGEKEEPTLRHLLVPVLGMTEQVL